MMIIPTMSYIRANHLVVSMSAEIFLVTQHYPLLNTVDKKQILLFISCDPKYTEYISEHWLPVFTMSETTASI